MHDATGDVGTGAKPLVITSCSCPLSHPKILYNLVKMSSEPEITIERVSKVSKDIVEDALASGTLKFVKPHARCDVMFLTPEPTQ